MTKTQKRTTNQTTLQKASPGRGPYGVFYRGGGGFEVTPLTEYPMNTTVRNIWK